MAQALSDPARVMRELGDQITGAIHVYGGDVFAMPRSEWNPQTFEEHPHDFEHTLCKFEEANERLKARA